MSWPYVSADPQDLQRLADAFDEAWIALSQQQVLDPVAKPAARDRLGEIIITVWQADPSADLAGTAIELFGRNSVKSLLESSHAAQD